MLLLQFVLNWDKEIVGQDEEEHGDGLNNYAFILQMEIQTIKSCHSSSHLFIICILCKAKASHDPALEFIK